MGLFDRSALVRAEVALYGPRRAAAALHPAAGRWPAHEAADRLALGVGAAALPAQTASDDRWRAYAKVLRGAATGIVHAGDGDLESDLVPLEGLGTPGDLAVVPWEGEGRAMVTFELLSSRGGPVPRVAGEPDGSGPTREVAALALLVALAVDGGAQERLALAFGIEGVLAWFRESDRRAPPRNALGFALSHADARLRETGRTLPPGL